ncbi:universal stress protein [Halalkalicoccus sp. NIPERK01]|uniref:universal stress protein n=1 Tax=Halalkalicoccus sp. NIPERK01 TaxID=3053469 RepID=UPI00256F329E|nr:universal stress protein [Halalkalicoccus sp. NIPERK01]MDL5362408.1 universal stress protein [Halalkalicoccus sp. NIPERK01]
MNRHVLVAMGATEASETALEHALREHPDARITIVHVTATSDPLGLFGDRDPEAYMVPECGFDLDDEVMPDGNAFNRAQRRRAERVFDRACELADEHEREIEPVVRSGNAVEEIVTCADERNVDRVVIADHQQTELRPLLWSVPESVARNASPPGHGAVLTLSVETPVVTRRLRVR